MKLNGSLTVAAGGEILNLRVENLATDPVAPVIGQIWFNATSKLFKYFDGDAVRVFAIGGNLDDLKADLASLDNGDGASLIGVEDSGDLYTATSVEAALAEVMTTVNSLDTASTDALAQHILDTASTDTDKGASLVGIADTGEIITATNVEAALVEIMVKLNSEISASSSALSQHVIDTASTANGKGASLTGVEDSGELYNASTVEGALAEVMTAVNSLDTSSSDALNQHVIDTASTANGKGASLTGIEDAGTLYTATTVEGALAEIHALSDSRNTAVTGRLTTNEGEIDDLEAAVGSDTGLAGNSFTATNYVTSGTSLVAAISTLDTSLKDLADLSGAADLQSAYENAAATAPDGHAKIKLQTGKDFRIVDDTDDSAYFMVDAETGDVTITSNLNVAGETVQVNSQITTFGSQTIGIDSINTVGLDIAPGLVANPVTSESAFTGDGTTKTFSFTLGHFPVSSGSVTISAPGVDDVIDDGNGFLSSSDGTTGTVDVDTGEVTLTYATAPTSGAATVDYAYTDGTYINPSVDIFQLRSVGGSATADLRVDSGGSLRAEKEAFFKSVTVDGNITVTGTVDGVEIAEFKTAYDEHVNGGANKHDATEIDYEKTDANYIPSGSDVEAALTALDAETKSINDAIGGSGGSSLSDLISNLTATVGTGEVTTVDFTTNHFVADASNIVTAISALDAQAKTDADNLATEITNRTNADTLIRTDFASVVGGKGASLVGVEDTGELYTATTVEGALAEVMTAVNGLDAASSNALAQHVTDTASTDNGKGASLTGVEDAGELYTATTVEGALAEVMTAVNTEATDRADADTLIRTDLASVTNGKGASLIGIEDTGGLYTATTVEGALSELSDRLSDSSFIYTSAGAATSHTVEHGFGQQYCNVTVIDATDNMVIPQSVVFVGANSLTVTFNSAIDCTVACSK